MLNIPFAEIYGSIVILHEIWVEIFNKELFFAWGSDYFTVLVTGVYHETRDGYVSWDLSEHEAGWLDSDYFTVLVTGVYGNVIGCHIMRSSTRTIAGSIDPPEGFTPCSESPSVLQCASMHVSPTPQPRRQLSANNIVKPWLIIDREVPQINMPLLPELAAARCMLKRIWES